jgi:ribose 5-phosphate isomerase A
VVVAEATKLVERIGQTFRLPVEVVRYGWEDTRRRLAPLLADIERRTDGTEPYVTDEGHYILDCAIPEGADVDRLNVDVRLVTGVVEHGLFLGMAERALLGEPDGSVRELTAG